MVFELTPEQWLEQGQAGRGRKKEPFRTLMPVEEVAYYRDGRTVVAGELRMWKSPQTWATVRMSHSRLQLRQERMRSWKMPRFVLSWCFHHKSASIAAWTAWNWSENPGRRVQ